MRSGKSLEENKAAGGIGLRASSMVTELTLDAKDTQICGRCQRMKYSVT
jgi:hypothetical protein